MARLSALRTSRLYPTPPQEISLVLISVRDGHRAAERIKSTQNLSGSTRNRTRKLLGCSTVPQPTAPPRALFPTTYSSYTTHRCQAFNGDLYSAYIQETGKKLYICTSTLGTLVKRTSTLNSVHYTSEQSSHISGWNRNSGVTSSNC